MGGLLRCLLLFLGISLVGCATQNSQPILSTESNLSVLAFSESARLQLDKRALAKAAHADSLTEMQWLQHTLRHSNDPRLQPDHDFEALVAVVAQQGAEISNLYAGKLAYFLLNEQFVCSEPLYYQYFIQRYHQAASTVECQRLLPFSLISKHNKDVLRWLDPERVSSVHLLFAGNDDGLISRFGHVQLRLVVCPQEDRTPEACDSNLYEHLVIGYRAHVDELNINTLKGLVGDYRAYLYAEEFMGSYRQYAINEFRDMFSLPLNLTDHERIAFVKSLAEIHWNFSGDYKFLTRNCATLLQNALRLIWPAYAQDKHVMNEQYLRPDSYFAAMKERPLTSSNVLDDLNLAETLGYYFSSTEPIYLKAVNQVQTEMTQAQFKDLDEYRMINPIERYQAIINDRLYVDKLKNDEVLLGAQSLIEEYSAIKSRSNMNAALVNYFENNDAKGVDLYMEDALSAQDYRVFSECIYKPMQALIRPKKRFDGIPNIKDDLVSQTSEFDCESDQNKTGLHRMNEQLEMMDELGWLPVKTSMFYWLESLNNVIRLSDLNVHH